MHNKYHNTQAAEQHETRESNFIVDRILSASHISRETNRWKSVELDLTKEY